MVIKVKDYQLVYNDYAKFSSLAGNKTIFYKNGDDDIHCPGVHCGECPLNFHDQPCYKIFQFYISKNLSKFNKELS